jgi:pimeloyl-ACP methyl ester carboxylesterase
MTETRSVESGILRVRTPILDVEARLASPPPIRVPTLLIHGADDGVNHPVTSEGKEPLFAGPYRRVPLPGAGHFPQRERPQAVNDEVLGFLREWGR